MPCLTESYRQLNAQLLTEDPSFATSGHRWAKKTAALMQEFNTTDVLDYGCGRRTLEETLGVPIRNYDPCIPGLDTPPEPADIVVCGDVMEHIEPECLQDVLGDLYRLSKIALLVVVATRPALRVLPDGRNAHLIQEKADWWLPKFWATGFRLAKFQDVRNQGHSIAFAAVMDKGE